MGAFARPGLTGLHDWGQHMCYGCKPFCENCKPKFVYCSQCGERNFLVNSACAQCGAELTEEEKEEAKSAWAQEHERGGRKTKGDGVCQRNTIATRP